MAPASAALSHVSGAKLETKETSTYRAHTNRL